MAFATSLFYAFLVLQLSLGSNAREIIKPKADQGLDPSLNVFFRVDDLYRGKKMSIYFAKTDDPTRPPPLSRDNADSIPFSLLKLPYLLQYFSISNESPQAKAMETTLKRCEHKAREGEIKFCATSLESMLDKTHGVLGMVRLKALTTRILNSSHTVLQGYTFVKKPLEIHTSQMVACHTMVYPYLVYYCHGQKGQVNRVFKILLGGENGERVNATAVCHMDTSAWDPDHVAFRVLGGQPGSSSVCHFLPAGDVVWIPST